MDCNIGFLINPVAGVGGPAGLKGSDGVSVQKAALARGASTRAGERALLALKGIAAEHPGETILTAAGAMGADAVSASGLTARVVHTPSCPTKSSDTTEATAALVGAGAELVVFVGGDGTARDVAAGLPTNSTPRDHSSVAHAGRRTASSMVVPVLGVPAGVKMYSGCFAVSPAGAAALVARWRSDPAMPMAEREVLDVDEQQIREGRVDPSLYALVTVPFIAGRTQSRKSAMAASEASAVTMAARGVVDAMQPGTLYLLGPGSTCGEVARQLGVASTPLGVDALLDGRVVRLDASENELLALLASHTGNARAVVTVIGGQGFLLGRGNQQISARVLRALGPDPLVVVATQAKITELGDRPLLVDSGEKDVDQSLTGYIRVITGTQSEIVYPVTAG